MKSLKLLIIFGSLFLLCKAADTDVYKCAKDLKADFCEASETKNNVTTHYYKGCPKGQKCDDFCIKNENKLLKEGKKCIIDDECQTRLCINEKCSYLSDGGDCNGSNAKCGPKSYCKNGKCDKLEVEGKSCNGEYRYEDNICVLGTICGTTGEDVTDNGNSNGNSKCIKMFSKKEGEKVSNPLMCESGLRDDDKKCIKRTTKTEEWDEYVKEYNKQVEKINDDEERKITDISRRKTLDNRNVAKKYVEIDQEYYEILDKAKDRDCIKDYYVTLLNGNRVNVSLISLFFFSIFFL